MKPSWKVLNLTMVTSPIRPWKRWVGESLIWPRKISPIRPWWSWVKKWSTGPRHLCNLAIMKLKFWFGHDKVELESLQFSYDGFSNSIVAKLSSKVFGLTTTPLSTQFDQVWWEGFSLLFYSDNLSRKSGRFFSLCSVWSNRRGEVSPLV